MKRHLERGWKSFERKVIGEDAGDSEREWMRAAFYAGALVVFTTLERQVSEGEEITEGDMNLMESLDAELREFAGIAVARGRAEGKARGQA